MTKISDALLGKLSDILKASSQDLANMDSVEKTEDYSEITEKSKIVRKIRVKIAETSPTTISKEELEKSKSLITDKMLTDINDLFNDILANKNHIKKSKVRTEQKVDVKKAKIRDKKSGKFLSLFGLQDLLNKELHDSIKRNMGKGSAKSILNYRSGRFANSAEITSIVKGKTGLLTAFYTYMKYPYQTFEPGFKQGSPASRDPRLLIGKSIRQLAVEIATIKLKAASA